ncbi:uncharacterized protein LOC144095680 [Amblyomma americanum]
MPGCCVPQCNNRAKNGWRMFSFPRDQRRRLLWTVKVKRDKWQPTNYSCICSGTHFEESCFEQNRADGWKKLKPNAVPMVLPFRVAPRKRKPPRDRTQPVPTSVNEEVKNPSTHMVPQDTSSVNLQVNRSDVESLNVGSPSSTDETPTASETQTDSAELKKQLVDMERKYATLQEHHTIAKNTIQNLEKQVQKHESKADNFAKNTRFLNADQISALSKNSTQGHTWSAETVKQGLQIKFVCGTTGYETLRKLGYPLPSSSTLARKIQGLKFLPGILQEVFDVMKCKAETMENVEKDCALFLDEMEIATAFELDRGEDALLGSITLPSEPEEPANHALVFMLGGINQQWKQVIGYEFTGQHVEGALLKDYVLDIVQRYGQISHRCKDALIGTVSSEYAALTVLKEYVSDGRNLIYPSSEVIRTLKNYEEYFTGAVAWYMQTTHTHMHGKEQLVDRQDQEHWQHSAL